MRTIAHLTLLILTVTSAHPSVFFGMDELFRPKYDNGKVGNQSFLFRHPEGGETRLEYNVIHTDKFVLRLDYSEWVEKLVCDDDEMQIFFNFENSTEIQTTVKQLTKGALIAGGAHWGCIDEGSRLSILRQVIDQAVIVDNFILVSTVPASHVQFFKDAVISFYTDVFPENQFTQYSFKEPVPLQLTSQDTHHVLQKTNKLGWFSTIITATWQKIKTLANTVKTVVKTVVEIAKVLATGNYYYNDIASSKSWSWNIANNQIIRPSLAIDRNINCLNCYATAGYALSFKLIITNYSLTSLTVLLNGTAEFQMQINQTFQTSFNSKNETLIGTVYMQPFTITVSGVPIVFNISVPIHVGYEFEFAATAVVDWSAKGSGSLAYGFEYTGSKWNWISQAVMKQSGGWRSIRLDLKMIAIGYIQPVAVVNIEYIGGPNIGLKAYLELVAEKFSTDSPCPTYGSFVVDTSWGLQFTLGAHIDIGFAGITILKKEWDPISLYSLKKPLSTGCVRLLPANEERSTNQSSLTIVKYEDSAVEIYNNGWIPGTSWNGNQTRIGNGSSCNQYPPYLAFSLQLTESYVYGPDMADLVFFGSLNYGTNQPDYVCTTESTYTAQIYMRTQLNLIVGGDRALEYKNCTQGGALLQPYGWTGTADTTWTTITLKDSMLCTQVILTRNPNI